MTNSKSPQCVNSPRKLFSLHRLTYWLLPLLALLSLFFMSSDIRRIGSPHCGLLGWVRRLHGWEHFQPPKEEHSLSRRRLTEDERLVLYGDVNAESVASRQKAIMDRWPDNPVYRGNYISEILSEFRRDPDAVKAELAATSQAEPDNARYPLLIAAMKAEQAASPGEDDELVVEDRALLDEAMFAMLEALERPVFKRYAFEMLQERMDILGTPRSMLESVERISFAAGILLPDLSHMRNLARTSRQYALLLANEGKADDAARFAYAWKRQAEHLQEDAFTLIDVLVLSSLITIGEESAEVFDILEMPEEAERMRALTRNWNEPAREWREKIKIYSDHSDSDISWRIGLLDALLTPALGEPVSDAELKAGRLVEYSLFQQGGVGILHSLAVLLMIGCWLLGLSWRIRRKNDKSTVTLFPSLGEYGRILGLGLLIPLTVYAALVAIPWIGGRQWGLNVNITRFAAQTFSALIIALMLTSYLIRRTLRARARASGIALPPGKPGIKFANLLTMVLAVTAATLAFLPYPADTPMRWSIIPLISLFVLGGVVLTRLLLTLCRLPSWLASQHWGGYYGTIARSAVPVYAAAAILLAWGLLPALRLQEANYVAQSTWGKSSITGFSSVEDRVTQSLLDEMRASHKAWKAQP